MYSASERFMTIYATPSEQFRPECLPSEQSQIFSMICVAKTTRNINYIQVNYELRRGELQFFLEEGEYSQGKEVQHLSFDTQRF